ncbi:hypothetical protein E4U43_000780 [Claviceps pusilla]|uniref:Uncharacterized protein n=1 Tax=Claviceps pusilla TaxID=123648 RepID=A0A9P7SZW0_9HYPO|nr:hypothetical protein E4U43_000780 [Claviceps pusilla]
MLSSQQRDLFGMPGRHIPIDYNIPQPRQSGQPTALVRHGDRLTKKTGPVLERSRIMMKGKHTLPIQHFHINPVGSRSKHPQPNTKATCITNETTYLQHQVIKSLNP